MGNGEYASTLDMSELWDRLLGPDRNDKGTSCLAKLCDGIGEDRDASNMLHGLQHHSCTKSAQSDFRFFS